MNKLHALKVVEIVDDCPDTSYLEQDEFKDRLEEYRNDGFYFVGIQAKAEILIPVGSHQIFQTIGSGGLWGIESDSDDEYKKEVAAEEIDTLKGILEQLNVDLSNFDEARTTALESI